MNFTMKALSVIAIAGTMVSEGWAETINLTATEGAYQISSNLNVQGSQQGQQPGTDDKYGPGAPNSQLPSGTVTLENKSRDSLVQIMLNASSRRDGDETTYPVGIELTYGQLFSKTEADLYSGFYRLSTKIDSDNTIRLNASSGYYVPFLGGEAMLSYRLLNSRLRDSFALTGEFEEGALEHGVELDYNQYFNSFMRSLGAGISYTDLNGKRKDQQLEDNSAGIWAIAQTATGFGGVKTGAVSLKTSLGSDGWEHPFLQGFRLELDAGYEEVRYDAFANVPGYTDSGLTASATASLDTVIGKASLGYHSGEASAITSISLGSSALTLYLRDIDYRAGNNETVYGLSLNGSFDDLVHPGRYFSSLFSPAGHLFPENSSGYKDISSARHAAKFSNDQFIAKPKIHDIRQNIFVVNTNALPPNVHLDTTRYVLTVTTQSLLSAIISVNPGNAAAAFSIANGRMEIDINKLPIQTQTITVKATESDGGETWVSIKTSVGSLHIDSVTVRENQNIPVEVPEVSAPAVENPAVVTPPVKNLGPTAVIDLISTEVGDMVSVFSARNSKPSEGSSIYSFGWTAGGNCGIDLSPPYTGFSDQKVKRVDTTNACVVSLRVCDNKGLCDSTDYTW